MTHGAHDIFKKSSGPLFRETERERERLRVQVTLGSKVHRQVYFSIDFSIMFLSKIKTTGKNRDTDFAMTVIPV